MPSSNVPSGATLIKNGDIVDIIYFDKNITSSQLGHGDCIVFEDGSRMFIESDSDMEGDYTEIMFRSANGSITSVYYHHTTMQPQGKWEMDKLKLTNKTKATNVVKNIFMYILIPKPVLELIPYDSDLTSTVSYIENVNNMIDYQENKLKTNLESKGVEVGENENMPNLIDKVNKLSYSRSMSGNIGTITGKGYGTTFLTVNTNSGFVPSLIELRIGQWTMSNDSNMKLTDVYITSVAEGKWYTSSSAYSSCYIDTITSNSFRIALRSSSMPVPTTANIKWSIYS